ESGSITRAVLRGVRGTIASALSSRLLHDKPRRDRMIRTGLIVVAALGLVSSMAWGQPAAPQSDDSRYTFNRVDDGYLRLDGRTAQVPIGGQRRAGWACQAVPDERAALEAEIARLQAENASVKKELIARKSAAAGHRQAGAAGRQPRRASPAI